MQSGICKCGPDVWSSDLSRYVTAGLCRQLYQKPGSVSQSALSSAGMGARQRLPAKQPPPEADRNSIHSDAGRLSGLGKGLQSGGGGPGQPLGVPSSNPPLAHPQGGPLDPPGSGGDAGEDGSGGDKTTEGSDYYQQRELCRPPDDARAAYQQPAQLAQPAPMRQCPVQGIHQTSHSQQLARSR